MSMENLKIERKDYRAEDESDTNQNSRSNTRAYRPYRKLTTYDRH